MLMEYRVTVARPGTKPADRSGYYIIEELNPEGPFRAAEAVAKREDRPSITLEVQEWKSGPDRAGLSSCGVRQDEVDVINVVRGGSSFKAYYLLSYSLVEN